MEPMDMASEAVGNAYYGGQPVGAMNQGLDSSIVHASEPKRREPIAIEGMVASTVVRLAMTGAQYDEVLAANDPDTGVITVRIGCQSHPVGRWRRVGARLIRQQYGQGEVERLSAALEMVLTRVEAEFAK